MLLAPIIALLAAVETDGKAEFRKVASAANFAAARDDLKTTPAAYVLPLSDAAGANQLACGAILQQVKEQFGVVLAVSNLRDATGMAAQVELERLRRLAIDALLGSAPGAGYDPVEYAGGGLLMMDTAALWWQLKFTTGYFEEK